MKTKICGITNRDDALNAIALNVDAVGFFMNIHLAIYLAIALKSSFLIFHHSLIQWAFL